ncbi:conserved domain protein [Eggerthella sp. HGA1]|nr:conserved domain protein [Eggerthella sp. HGA1]
MREVEHGGIPYCHAHGRTPHDTVCKDARVARNAKCVLSHEPPQSFLRLPT